MLYINVNVGGVKYTTYYYHLLTVNVKVGDVVTQNTVIGTVGGYSTSTTHGGYDSCTTGAHLHFGVAKGYYSGSINRANVITPPGFPNAKGYRFTSRTDYYG
jgi:murein DD-endopeptidase MepM/ murein hydrolase activator NlpD